MDKTYVPHIFKLAHFIVQYDLLLLFNCPVMSNSLWPHGLQHARPTYPSSSPRVCPSSCSLHRWCCPAVSSSNVFFSFCPQPFPASGVFFNESSVRIRWSKYWSFSFSIILPGNIQSRSPLSLIGLISLLSKGLSGVFNMSTLLLFSHSSYWGHLLTFLKWQSKLECLSLFMVLYTCMIVSLGLWSEIAGS